MWCLVAIESGLFGAWLSFILVDTLLFSTPVGLVELWLSLAAWFIASIVAVIVFMIIEAFDT